MVNDTVGEYPRLTPRECENVRSVVERARNSATVPALLAFSAEARCILYGLPREFHTKAMARVALAEAFEESRERERNRYSRFQFQEEERRSRETS